MFLLLSIYPSTKIFKKFFFSNSLTFLFDIVVKSVSISNACLMSLLTLFFNNIKFLLESKYVVIDVLIFVNVSLELLIPLFAK